MLLLAIVVGSGVMGERLAGGSVALALLANSLATGAGLMVLILVLGPISGAHLNPVVTFVFALKRDVGWSLAGAYALAQCAGAAAGVLLAHAMFDQPLLQASMQARDGSALIVSEMVAAFGLVFVILGGVRFRPEATPYAVGLYITAAYWFTASTSFANPAVTLARTLTDTFTGIALASVPAFVAAQAAGALAAWLFMDWITRAGAEA
ncbi:aquaporin family protein [bacterium]|nr:aquaporin family protein [bacterium]